MGVVLELSLVPFAFVVGSAKYFRNSCGIIMIGCLEGRLRSIISPWYVKKTRVLAAGRSGTQEIL